MAVADATSISFDPAVTGMASPVVIPDIVVPMASTPVSGGAGLVERT